MLLKIFIETSMSFAWQNLSGINQMSHTSCIELHVFSLFFRELLGTELCAGSHLQMSTSNSFLDKVVGLIPIQATHLKVGLCVPYGSIPTQNIPWFCDISPFLSSRHFRMFHFLYCGHQQWDFYRFTVELLCIVHICASSLVLW